MKFNAMDLFAREYGVPFVNFNRIYQEIDFDYTQDIRDGSHVNNKGAAKVTAYLGAMMKESAELPDRRGDAAYQDWERHSRYLEGKDIFYQLEEPNEIETYLDQLTRIPEDYLIILSLDGNFNALGEVFADNLAAHGIDMESYHKGGVWVWKDQEILFNSDGEWEYERAIRAGETTVWLQSHPAFDEEGTAIKQSDIVIDGENFQKIQNGVNVVVYDTELNCLIDAAGTDVYLGLDMIREE